MSGLSQFVKEADEIDATLKFVAERVKDPVAAPFLGVGPVRKKRVDEFGNILLPTIGNKNKRDLFGKPLPGTLQEKELIENEIRRIRKYGPLLKMGSAWNSIKQHAVPIGAAAATLGAVGGGLGYVRNRYRKKQKAERIARMLAEQNNNTGDLEWPRTES